MAKKVKLHTPEPASTPTLGQAHLKALCAGAGLPEPECEYEFHPGRRWRLDWFWRTPGGVLTGVALELEGGTAVTGESRHTNPDGYENDIRKYNAAALAGILVLRATTKMFVSGEIFKDLERLLKPERA